MSGNGPIDERNLKFDFDYGCFKQNASGLHQIGGRANIRAHTPTLKLWVLNEQNPKIGPGVPSWTPIIGA